MGESEVLLCLYVLLSLLLTYSFVVLFLTECLLYAEYINRFHFLVAAFDSLGRSLLWILLLTFQTRQSD